MILGETGCGKESWRFIHNNSTRVDKPFIPVDCSSLSDTLFESELFGHVKGAFTGATRDSLGFIRAADSGTLFLDEIADLSLHLQAKLLRVLQEKWSCPSVISRTPGGHPRDQRHNRPLEAMVREGTFRQDLFFRLNVVVLKLPPLRERKDDILSLAEHFLKVQSDLYGEPVKTLEPQTVFDVAGILVARKRPRAVQRDGTCPCDRGFSAGNGFHSRRVYSLPAAWIRLKISVFRTSNAARSPRP